MDNCKWCGCDTFFGGFHTSISYPDDKRCKNVGLCNEYLIKKLKEENEKLKGLYQFGTEGKNGEHIMLNKQGDLYYSHTTAIQIQKLKEENEELKEEVDSLSQTSNNLQTHHRKIRKELEGELEASRQMNIMYHKFIKDIKTEQNLAEMIGLGKDTGTDVAITHIAQEYVENKELKKENQKLKEDMEHLRKNPICLLPKTHIN